MVFNVSIVVIVIVVVICIVIVVVIVILTHNKKLSHEEAALQTPTKRNELCVCLYMGRARSDEWSVSEEKKL